MSSDDTGQKGVADHRGTLWGYLPKSDFDIKSFFDRINATFGEPKITDELVLFFEYEPHMRLRFTCDGVTLRLSSQGSEMTPIHSAVQSSNVFVPLSEAESLVRTLYNMGFEQSKMSYSTKYIYKNALGSFIIRFNEELGDFYQYFISDSNSNSKDDVQTILSNVLAQLRLTPWTDEQHTEYLGNVMDESPLESIVVDEGRLHPKISKLLIRYDYSRLCRGFSEGETIQSAMSRVSNDYTDLEEYYFKTTATKLLSSETTPYSNAFRLRGSIVIPAFGQAAYYTLPHVIQSICRQNLTPAQFNAFEVIIVDDGTPMAGLDMIFDKFKHEIEACGMTFHMLRSYSNRGRAIARNLGASIASGNILFFLDADIILNENYLRESMVRHQVLGDVVLVGFKENIALNSTSVQDNSIYSQNPNFQQDFRLNRHVTNDWIGLYPVNKDCVVKCLEETSHFKNFGFGKVVGPYDLACMVVTHNISLRRRQFDKCGGFDSRFSQGWGLEDTYLGANLIARRNHIIPLISTGVFHVEPIDEIQSGTRQKKYNELSENYRLYVRLVQAEYYPESSGFEAVSRYGDQY